MDFMNKYLVSFRRFFLTANFLAAILFFVCVYLISRVSALTRENSLLNQLNSQYLVAIKHENDRFRGILFPSPTPVADFSAGKIIDISDLGFNLRCPDIWKCSYDSKDHSLTATANYLIFGLQIQKLSLAKLNNPNYMSVID